MATASYPGLIYPSESYPGVAGVFRTPTIQRPLTVDRPQYRPFNRVKINVALTVLKTGSSYVTVEQPTAEQVDAADIAYIGGRDWVVDDAEAAALTAAGYTVEAL